MKSQARFKLVYQSPHSKSTDRWGDVGRIFNSIQNAAEERYSYMRDLPEFRFKVVVAGGIFDPNT